ncbi:MAG: right-handed parallel beta-helix repeat-containing protein [bacterium]|nr:right-handed parallel beta-helix repeat-containing protein [bacterium]
MTETSNGIDLFAKVHGMEQLGKSRISVDIEIVTVDDTRIVGGQAVEFSMNDKTHRLATMSNGRLRAELIFPMDPGKRQTLSATACDTDGHPCNVEIFPPQYEEEPTRKEIPSQPVPLSLEGVLSGERAISRGEIFNIPKGFYDATGDIAIKRGGKLVIEKGTTIEMGENGGILCEGVLEAKGTPDAKITFSAVGSQWRNILVFGRHVSGTRFRHCLIEHGAGRALKMDDTGNTFQPITQTEKSLPRNGGGLMIVQTQNADILLEHVTIRENNAKKGKGGGIFLYDSAAVIGDCEILKNRSGLDGGGIHIEGLECKRAILKDSCIHDNMSGNDGGGIYLEGVSPVASQLDIRDNAAQFGGGLYHNHLEPDDIRFDNCRIEDNEAIAAPEDSWEICGNWL